jgi:GNAT superfamily N-acetyltransferase
MDCALPARTPTAFRLPSRPLPPLIGRTHLPLGRVWRAAAHTESPCGQGYRVFLPGGYIDAVKIRPREAGDQAAAQAFLARHNSLRGARLGELVHPLDHPAFVAEAADGYLLGMLTYVPGHDWQQCEIHTLHAGEQWRGAGTALIEAVGQLARQQGCARLWVITTNNNVDALRFYQRRGFCLVTVHRGAVDRSRARLKPEIPSVGAYGIPLRDEIELEKQP